MENDRLQIQETGTCHSISNNKSIVDSTYYTQKELHADSNKILEQNVKGLMSESLKEEAVATWIQCGCPRISHLRKTSFGVRLLILVTPQSKGPDLADSVYPDDKMED